MACHSATPPIRSISLLSVQGSLRRCRREACFLMILNGEVQVQMDGHPYYLNDYGILLVEPDVPMEVTGRGSNLLMSILMDCDFFLQGSAGRFGTIVCNSAQDDQRDYTLLRQMLSHLALTYYEKGECRELRLLELCYSILYYLNTTHFVPGGPDRSDSRNHELRSRQIISYMESNYMHDIRLDDLSRATYLSPSYLSRLFKKTTGTNFKAYLEDIRLRHAVEDLRSTDQTITAIAYNNGFPNVRALSTTIRRVYRMSPNEFRRTLAKPDPEPEASEPCSPVEYGSVRESLELLAGPEPAKALGIFRYPDQIGHVVPDVTSFRPIPPIWKSMINVGTLHGLSNVNARAQLVMLQEEIGFQYARIEAVLSEDFMPLSPDGQYNFALFDRAIEMLLSVKLTPFLDLSFRGAAATLIPRSSPLYRGDTPRTSRTPSSFNRKASLLIRHCINTFGAGEVEKWGVELCAIHDKDLSFAETPAQYAQRFLDVYTMIKALLPNMVVGGPQQHIAKENRFLCSVAAQLRKWGVTPDFFSLCAIPYEPVRDGDGLNHYVLSSRPNYIRDRVSSLRADIREVCGDHVPLWVTVLGPDIRMRNHVNDGCHQATFFVKNTVDLIGLADVIGYWQLSDLDAEYKDTPRLLFGGSGILSKDGLKKPGFTALKRLSRMNTLLIQREEDMLVTTNAINTYNILLYNHAHFTDLYCLTNGEDVTCENAYSVFRDAATRDVSITLHHLLPGRYKVITTTLNRESGSLFDEWMRFGIQDGLQPQDIRYLRDIVHPQRIVRYHDCDGTLQLTAQMLPHEVKFLLLLREL